ncbi:GNAT family N-acetyltransferase [Halobacillus sp. A5]|uniref:GNAT family N-acetyltransferase n=1 Tax=Halobacillus sp. A5 TaxID=2880263 RepID=UPI0020A6836A|nr:GNAT family N-acetyltransferase [Halobacillus sp. A5]MCP3025922.1 GNAT family N-acetyltransferase [Halobacillus sp. A5]
MDKWVYGYDVKSKRFNHIHIRNYEEQDFSRLIEVQKKAFPPPFPSDLWWDEEQLYNHISIFRDGCICIEVEGEIAGSMTAMRTEINENTHHTWEEVTAGGTMRTHNPNGSVLYVVDICIDPAYRSLGLGSQLTQAMYETVVHYKLDRLMGGARMPAYHKYKNDLTPEEYVNLVLKNEITDPVLTFLFKAGRSPVCPMAEYIDDKESCNYGLITEWRNPFT